MHAKEGSRRRTDERVRVCRLHHAAATALTVAARRRGACADNLGGGDDGGGGRPARHWEAAAPPDARADPTPHDQPPRSVGADRGGTTMVRHGWGERGRSMAGRGQETKKKKKKKKGGGRGCPLGPSRPPAAAGARAAPPASRPPPHRPDATTRPPPRPDSFAARPNKNKNQQRIKKKTTPANTARPTRSPLPPPPLPPPAPPAPARGCRARQREALPGRRSATPAWPPTSPHTAAPRTMGATATAGQRHPCHPHRPSWR